MKRSILGVLAVTALLMAPTRASAAQIVGAVDYTGTHTLVDGTDFTNATSTTINSAFVLLGQGDFAALVSFGDVLAHASPINYDSPSSFMPLWVHGSGLTFNLTSFFVDSIDANTLVLKGVGEFVNIPGYDDTPGVWNMTLNLATGFITGSFSSSSATVVTPVPEPGLLVLMGVGMLGVARRFRASR